MEAIADAIRIGASTVKVNLWKAPYETPRDSLERRAFGYTAYDEDGSINVMVDRGYDPAETLLHELVHVLDYMHGLGLEENQVQGLVHGLRSAFYENQWLIGVLGKSAQEVREEWLPLSEWHEEDDLTGEWAPGEREACEKILADAC